MKLQVMRFCFFVVSAAGLALLFSFNPESTLYPPCIFKRITHLQCPGCGSARACYHLLHGNLVKAMDYNLLLTTFLPFIMIDGFARLFAQSARAQPGVEAIRRYIKPGYVLIVVIVFWLVRNLPFYPFTLLSSDH